VVRVAGTKTATPPVLWITRDCVVVSIIVQREPF
jgi:hypothetical protein